MNKFFAQTNGQQVVLEGDEFAHFNVLRLKEGDQVLCFDGSINEYVCKVTEVQKKKAILKVIKTQQNSYNPQKNISVFQATPKGEKIDLIIQKISELGATSLYIFESEFCIAKNNPSKLERLVKIAREASKQCGRSTVLNIQFISFNQMLELAKHSDICLFANETNKSRNFSLDLKSKNNIAIIVGSEGGFSEKEINKIAEFSTNFGLGQRILRCETASISLTALASYLSDN